MKEVQIHLHVGAPVERVFDVVTDHESFLRDAGTRTKVIRDGAPERNALGCLREVHGRGMRFVEEVTAWKRPTSYEYMIRETTLPLRHHGGRLTFTPNDGGTDVEWTTRFEITTPLVGGLLAGAAERIATKAFTQLLVAAKNRLEAESPADVRPIGVVHSLRTRADDDHWDAVPSFIELDGARFTAEALAGLDAFSHVEVLFRMDRVQEGRVETGARHPRNNPTWPKVGIFAQRAKSRPNRIGATICQIERIEGLRVYVKGLDAIDGSPVLDLKPWVRELGPRGEVRQPAWVGELMKDYWV